MKHTSTVRHRSAVAALAAGALLLTGCGAAATTPQAEAPSSSSASVGTQPRVITTYDGGVLVLDAATLAVVQDIKLDGFTRINPAGDGSHVLVSTPTSFRALDAGAPVPAFTDVEFPANKPGHVVRHAGKTVLFSDGTGRVEIFDSAAIAGGRPATEVHTTAEAHHGVAIELANGELVTTLGNEKSRTGIVVLDKDRREIVRNEQCPGVHGEAAAANETVVVGCQDGVLVYRGGTITKIQSPDAYGRIGNQAGSDASPVVLGDYKKDKDAELERPQTVSLIDTATQQLRLVELGTSYTFRSLARGPEGDVLVLGTDGAIHVIDPDTAAVAATIPVIGTWTEPLDWQQPRPAITVNGSTAYVTEPATRTIHAVDLATGKVLSSAPLPQVPNELTAVTG
ncbi:zinc metallochaperone AztD [Arthrobacter sp. 35W]|uniref:zinc metallochaperone AztD n=1 Tax=Arthrobacter sp. 35W TaxID=1132441 RepID=UPI0003F96E3F|nr:zinc metallochaperone AztD [Arthrobacter sp. 35W]